MALSAYTIFEARGGSGSDTACSGAFDPSQTAGMNTDGAATSATGTAPVFSSASYNFVSGDVGAYVYIAAGTNWIPGWYEIASVAANAATLNATSGEVALGGNYIQKVSSSNGCATSASPTGATWTIDYSQQSSAQFSYTDLVIGATTTNLTSVGNPFGKQQVGNIIQVTSGSGFTTGFYCILSVSTVTATMDRSVGTAASTAGHGYQGGALATFAGLIGAPNNSGSSPSTTTWIYWVKASASYVFTSTLVMLGSTNSGSFIGYGTVRGDGGKATVTTATNSTPLIQIHENTIQFLAFRNFAFTTTASTKSFCFEPYSVDFDYFEFSNCTFNGFTYAFNSGQSGTVVMYLLLFFECVFTSCTDAGIFFTTNNSGQPSNMQIIGCLFNGCNIGIEPTDYAGTVLVCATVIYNSTAQGIYMDYGPAQGTCITLMSSAIVSSGGDAIEIGSGGTPGPGTIWSFNSIYSQNGGYVFDFNVGAYGNLYAGASNAYYDNTSGLSNGAGVSLLPSDVTLTGDPFVDKATLDFTLNTTAGAGAACTGAGWQSSIL